MGWGLSGSRAPCAPPIGLVRLSENHLGQNGSRITNNHSGSLGSSFFKLSVASPTSQLILQSFRRFTYVTAHTPILPLLHLRHSSFSNPSFASPTSQDLHLTSPSEPPMCCSEWYFHLLPYNHISHFALCPPLPFFPPLP